MVKNTNTTSGNLKMSENVIETISQITVDEIKGVHSLSNKHLSFKDFMLKSDSSRPIRISATGEVATIDIWVNLYYGYNIKDVCTEIQSLVKKEVQTMAGITVSKVNVNVADVIFEDKNTTQ